MGVRNLRRRSSSCSVKTLSLVSLGVSYGGCDGGGLVLTLCLNGAPSLLVLLLLLFLW